MNPYPRPVTYHPFGGPGSAVIAWFSGDVGEVILFDTALAREELAAISDALLTKWRL